MTQLLMLDAAFPPDPGSLIADITTVQANGAFLYVWGPFVNGTPAHVRALQAAGLQVAPIIVPGNIPPTPDMLVKTVYAWGFYSGVVFFDFERGSDPGKPWLDATEAFFSVHGYHAEPYGTLATLGQYDPDDKDWVAFWLRTGVLDPLPQLPQDWEAWQFVNDININGHQYDASVVNAGLFGGDLLTNAQKLAYVRLAYNAFLWRVPTPDEENQWAGGITDDGTNLDAILAQIEDSDEGNLLKAHRTKLLQIADGTLPLPAGPPGPPGPPGAFEHHQHHALTDTGTPATT